MTSRSHVLAMFLQKHEAKIVILGFYLSLLALMLFIPKIYHSKLSHKKSLSIVIFPETVSIEVIRAFTEETGIQINIKNVEADAEIKTYVLDSSSPYDLTCAPEYLAMELAAEDKIIPLDEEKIPNYTQLHPLFIENQKPLISVPFAWTLFGIGANKNEISLPSKVSWDILFNPSYKICVPDDPRHLITLAGLMLHKPLQKLSEQDISDIIEKLFAQKKHVELYTDMNIGLLFANNIVPLAFCSYNTIEFTSKSYPHLRFIVPTEGAIRASQDWVILRSSKNVDLAHQFINFVISKKIAAINQEITKQLPTNQELLAKYWEPKTEQLSSCQLPPLEIIKKAKMPCGNISSQKISDLWITLKSS